MENLIENLTGRLQYRGIVLFAQIVSTKKTMFFQHIADISKKTMPAVCFGLKSKFFSTGTTESIDDISGTAVSKPSAQAVISLDFFCRLEQVS